MCYLKVQDSFHFCYHCSYWRLSLVPTGFAFPWGCTQDIEDILAASAAEELDSVYGRSMYGL